MMLVCNDWEYDLDHPTPKHQILTKLIDQFKNESDVTPGIIKDALYNKQYMEFIYQILE